MCIPPVSDDGWLSRLTEHLENERYHPHIVTRWTAVARHFLRYLEERGTRVEGAQPSDVAGYLRCERRRYVRRHHHRPPSISGWQNSHTGGIHMLLRLVRGAWPPPSALVASEQFHATLTKEYAAWMQDRRGLASETCRDRCEEARRFLNWLGPIGTAVHLNELDVPDLDAYVASRAASLRRVTLKGVTVKLRSFLRHLYATGRTPRDLSVTIVGPRVYADEAIPSALRAEDVRRVLEVTRRDRSAIGRRDYAILMLLARYGLRAGEVTALRLDDLDWRHDRLRVRHSKTHIVSELPLLTDVGDAIVQYLRDGRPSVRYREIFIRSRAPYRPFRSGSSLYTPIRDRLDAAGIRATGKRGPHAFRHTRAVTLLRAAVPAKHIGDLLGHRSPKSTTVYLKLATEDLRAVSLEIPTGVTV
ncbi:MAG: site-specific integrase [Vicinamibacteraceae bacterium]